MIRTVFTTSVRLLLATAFTAVLAARGQPSAESHAGTAAVVALDQHALDKRTGSVLKGLKLDAAKEPVVRHTLEAHLQAVYAWHESHEAELSAQWNAWAAARTPPHSDAAKAGEIAQRIDGLYAQFQPQHDAFIAALARELSTTQVEQVKNALTKSPGLQRTYEAYLKMIPTFTDAQKRFIHQKLELAREQAIDAATDKEKVSLFKKRKVEIEAYIDAQGLDYKSAYKAFADRIKNESEKKAQQPE